jgi:tripartite-type tricarboxylate transporter receptor subunit TctC
MVIPFGAGGATDISARTIAEPLGNAVGKPLVMANVTGAGGATGSVTVQNATPDGYAMLFCAFGLAFGEPGDEGDAALYAG